MKKITRNQAISMFRLLGTMALGHMDENTLTVTLDNFDKFRRVQEDYQKLAEELSKRIYEGTNDEKKNAFFEMVGKFEQERELAKKIEMEKMMKDTYPDFYALYVKQIAVLTKMFTKEIEVDITEVDKDEFIKGVVKGKKDIPVHEIVEVFGPLFKEEEKVEETQDFSELDELLKD